MNLSAFERKLETLKLIPHLDVGEVERFGRVVSSLDDWELFRINPLRFADSHGFALPLLLDLLIHSVKIGLFDFFWSVICPACGGVEYTYDSINHLKQADVFCTTCNISVSCDLDEQVEVSFTINPAIQDLSQQVNPFAGMETYLRYFFSANYQRSPALQAFARSHFLGFDMIEPDHSLNLTLQAEAGHHYRLINLQSHSQLALYASSEQSPVQTHVETDLLGQGFAQEALSILAGDVRLAVHNRSHQRMIITSWKADFERLRQILNEAPHTRTPFYTAKMLLSNQTFREQFRIQQLDQDLKLNIRSLTLLFTDLKGSTEMYERAGDYQAYSLVQQHFNLLAGCVRRNAGSIVKTMGDAIMATFTSPLDGARAAREMLDALASLPGSEQLGLKIGLHEGPVLAVNADERLDYFGQSVNLAARVQGLAEAGEIWLTETVYQDLKGNCPLRQAGFAAEARSAQLKGVSAPARVYRFFKPESAD